jgi:AraC-like DNA-binding protein
MPKSSKIEAYWIYFDAKSANKNLFDLIGAESVVEVDDDELITRLFESILYNVENLPEISKVFNDKCFVLRMISYIIEKGGYKLNEMPLLKIADYMEENMERKISVEEISDILKVKNNHCTNLFNETFGSSPIKFLNDIRLLKARTLLENTDVKVGEIGTLCGLGDVQAFSKTFKANVGITPSKYRHIFGKTFKVE